MKPLWTGISTSHRLFLLVVFVAVLAGKKATTTTALGPKTNTQINEDRFIHCLLAIDRADANSDNRLSREEFSSFTKQYHKAIFDDDLEEDVSNIYTALVTISSSTTQEIDVYGADYLDVRNSGNTYCTA